MTVIIGSIENGAYVARVPSRNIMVRVPLKPIGTRVGGVEIGAVCERLGTPEVSGKLWRKIKKKAKKAVKKTVSIAKKVAKNKIVKTLYNTAKSLAPSPINQVLGAVETGVKFGKALAKGSSAAKAALPVVKRLAAGKITLKAAQKMAPQLGVKPATIRDAAATIKLREKAKTNPKVAQLFRGVAEIESANVQEKQQPPARGRAGTIERIVRGPSGRRYAVSVRPAA